MKSTEFTPGYRISENGMFEACLRSMRSGKTGADRKWTKITGSNNRSDKKGYLQVKIVGKYKGNKHTFIHRLVAEAFVPNKFNKPEVNHIDGNKMNNSASNLEWVTRHENMQHSVSTGLKDMMKVNSGANHVRSRPVMCVETGVVYNGCQEAQRELGLPSSAGQNISAVCRGERKVCFGYGWEYV